MVLMKFREIKVLYEEGKLKIIMMLYRFVLICYKFFYSNIIYRFKIDLL